MPGRSCRSVWSKENALHIAPLYRLSGAEARNRTKEVLERFGLVDAADRRVSTDSGGMRRRLDLAAGLIGRPPVVLLDEPTTGLDPRPRQELRKIVDELRQEGTTVLLTTQYLDEADRLAQHIAVVDRGRIAAQGTAAQLKAAIGGNVLSVRVADPTACPPSRLRWPTSAYRRTIRTGGCLMSTTNIAIPDRGRLTLAETLADSRVMAARQLRKIVRRPMYVVYRFVQPVIFVLLFRYVFGGAINTGYVSYVNFLLPGLIAMTAIFGSLTTGLGLTEDMATGVVDRFRSLPIARSSVLIGRTAADLATNLVSLIVMLMIGIAVGFRPSQPIYDVVLAFALILAFAYVFSWSSAYVGVSVRNPDRSVGRVHLGLPARLRLLGVRTHRAYARSRSHLR